MIRKILLIYSWGVRVLFYFFPDIPIIMRLRGWLYGMFMKKAGYDFQVTHDAIIKDLQGISVGRHVFIGNHSVVMGSGTIEMGDEVMLAPHVVIISGNHSCHNQSYRYGRADVGHIEIGRGAWIAANSTVQKNSKLPSGSVLSANSFLNKVFTEENSVYGGVPARFLKKNEDA